MLDSDPTSIDFESYCSVDEADDILAIRGKDGPWLELTLPQKEVQLRLCTEYLDNNYQYIGYPTTNEQPLRWPRVIEVRYDSDEIPDVLKRATAQLAVDSLRLPLYTDIAASSTTGAQIKSTSDKLDVMSSEVSYFQGNTGKTQTDFIQVTRMLKPITSTLNIQRG